MNVLLIDVDSTIPNIALGKLSMYHKLKGDTVDLNSLSISYYPHKNKHTFVNTSNYEIVYVSAIFKNTIQHVVLPNMNNFITGGTGFEEFNTLPEEVENLEVDYSLWPGNNISYGFITRGCIRHCAFCVVPKKEGMIRKVSDWQNIVKHKSVKFLDNNILALDGHKEIIKDLNNNNIKYQFNQGLDIRLIDDTNAKLLSEAKYIGEYVFAFDDISLMNVIKLKINILNKYITGTWRLKFFVYMHPDMELSNIIRRIMWLRENKYLAYAMRNIECWSSKNKEFYTDIASWCNQVQCFKALTFEQFLPLRHVNNKVRVSTSLELWRNNQ